jgi:Flp pilus assembly protein TadD
VVRRVFLPLFLTFFGLRCEQASDPSAALQAAVAALQKSNFAAAEIQLREELKVHPNDSEILSLLGFALDSQQKFQEADAFHRRATAGPTTSPAVLGRYAHHLQISGDTDRAREVFRKVIEADPADTYANLQLAQLLLKSKDPSHAKEALGYPLRSDFVRSASSG